jgi:hypothetical protein
VVRVDSDPARQALFANLVRSRRLVRVVLALHGQIRGTWGGALLISSYGLAAFFSLAPPRNRRARVLLFARHANAERQVGRVRSWIGQADCDWIGTGKKAMPRSLVTAQPGLLLSPGRIWRALRLVRSLDTKYGFLVSCRSAGAMGWYARSRSLLAAHDPGAVLVSSDSQPEEIAFVAAARAAGIPQVFVSHAYPTPLSPPLDFTLSILEGEAAVRARERKGPIRGDVLLAGVEGESAAMDATRFERPRPVIGIFTPKAISWPTLAAIVEDCRRHFAARRIVIRWHPSMLQATRLHDVFDDLSDVVVSPRTAALEDVAKECDWVVADQNSNVHLPVLKLGIPTIAVKGLGVYPPSHTDQYGFIAASIVFPAVASIRDVEAPALTGFFGQCWASRFAGYDASYLRDAESIGRDVGQAIRALVAHQPEPAAR